MPLMLWLCSLPFIFNSMRCLWSSLMLWLCVGNNFFTKHRGISEWKFENIDGVVYCLSQKVQVCVCVSIYIFEFEHRIRTLFSCIWILKFERSFSVSIIGWGNGREVRQHKFSKFHFINGLTLWLEIWFVP
jgi:hypothetical protein